MGLTLVTGGVRSGKSRWAEELAGRFGERILYVATASPVDPVTGQPDPEMQDRIRRHRARRPASWWTLEEPVDVAGALHRWLAAHPVPDAVLLECLTVLLSHWLLAEPASAGREARLLERADALAATLSSLPCPAVVVSNEVGWGVVPANELARAFRDLAGRVNQIFANRAEAVYVIWSGIPVEIKSLAARTRGGGAMGRPVVDPPVGERPQCADF